MKLKLLFVALMILVLAGSPAYSAVGDVAGNIYTTDICAYIDGMPVESYNIGGKTAIIVENLREYGFSVEWMPQERLLITKTGYMPENKPAYTHIAETPGNIAGTIYQTDIRTIINGIEVPSYNIGGLTAVAIEDLGNLGGGQLSYDGNSHRGMGKPYTDLGMYHIWNQEERTISLFTLRPGTKVSTDFGEVIADTVGENVERISYTKYTKSLCANDGRIYSRYTDGLSVDGKLYVMLYDVMEIFGGRADVTDGGINIRTNVENAIKLRYTDSLAPQECRNILYPIRQKLFVNNSPADSDYADFYLYKGEIFVSCEALNAAAGKLLLTDIEELPQESMHSRGRVINSDHILYINGRAVDSYLSSAGEYYIPVDGLSDIRFDILSSVEGRILKTPEKLPEIVDEAGNIPESYFLQDTEGKGYICEIYNGIHSVKIDDKVISCVYIHMPDTYLTPCIALDEFVEVLGYGMEKSGDAIRVYTRKDRMTMGVDKGITTIFIYKGNEMKKSFPIGKYQGVGVFGDYLYLELSGDETVSEIYSTETLEKITEVKGSVFGIGNGRIFTTSDKENYIYDMSGKLLESYFDNK